MEEGHEVMGFARDKDMEGLGWRSAGSLFDFLKGSGVLKGLRVWERLECGCLVVTFDVRDGCRPVRLSLDLEDLLVVMREGWSVGEVNRLLDDIAAMEDGAPAVLDS